MDLSLRRFLNLVYYRIVSRVGADDKRKIDRLLENKPMTDPDAPPSWWQGDEQAAQSGLAVARALGMKVAMN